MSLTRPLAALVRTRPVSAVTRSPFLAATRSMSGEPPSRHGVIIVNPDYVENEAEQVQNLVQAAAPRLRVSID
jgi:hypothetical protein